jgi:hypothetical protein
MEIGVGWLRPDYVVSVSWRLESRVHSHGCVLLVGFSTVHGVDASCRERSPVCM